MIDNADHSTQASLILTTGTQEACIEQEAIHLWDGPSLEDDRNSVRMDGDEIKGI
jgi:hypothetical protein